MADIRPFRGIRPRSELAAQVLAPPYDVLSEAEARAIVEKLPDSFLRVTRPEVNLPEGCDAHSPDAYAAAHAALLEMLERGVLVQDERPCFYFYGQRMGDHAQVALMALCSVQEYDQGLIKKHEYTRPDKEQDRVDHIEGVQAQTGLVFLACRDTPSLAELLEQARPETPLFSVTSDDGVQHTLWRVDDPVQVAAVTGAFAQVPALYIADGHHRSAAASRVSGAHSAQGSTGWFLAGIFPDTQLSIMAYNRLVNDLNGHSVAAFKQALSQHFSCAPTDTPLPASRGTFTMFLDQQWWLLEPLAGVVDPAHPVNSLDVAVLQDRVLSPLLGIHDPRRDTRVQFVGGIRGPEHLEREVRAGRAAVGFQLYPTGLEQLFSVADADQVMPPKSTWFEPKLRGGVLVHKLER